MIWTSTFWKGAAERFIKTFAQALVGFIAVGTTGIFDLDWTGALSVSVAAALASLLTSIGNADFTAGVSAAGNESVAADVVNDGSEETDYSDEVDDPEAGDMDSMS